MPRILLLCAVLTISTTASSRALEDFQRQLKRAPPVSTAFVEYRFSHLLKKPLRASGTLEYRADGVLARNVDAPYHEVTEVSGDEVRMTRGDKPTRTMSLQRAPQLRVLLGSFRALLEGSLVPLQQDFDVTLAEEGANWSLTLKPRDAQLARHLARIEVFGNGDRPGCLEALEPDGDGAITFMSDSPPTISAQLPARADLERRCRAPGPHGAADATR